MVLESTTPKTPGDLQVNFWWMQFCFLRSEKEPVTAYFDRTLRQVERI